MTLVSVCVCITPQPRVAVTTTAVTSICPKCGITKKSGIMSCCGRGGSWFGNCGGIRDTNIGHTWYEGLQACKAQAQSKAVIGQELSDVSQERNASPSGVDTANSKSVAMAAKSAASASSRMAGAPPTVVSANISTAYATSKITSQQTITGTTAMIFSPVNMSTLTPIATTVGNPITTAGHMSTIRHTSPKISMTAPVGAAVKSQGCEKLLDLTIYNILVLAVALC